MKKIISAEEGTFNEVNVKKLAKLGFRLSKGWFYLKNFYQKIDFYDFVENISTGKKLLLCRLLLNSMGVHIVKQENSYSLGAEEGVSLSILEGLADRAEVLQEQEKKS